eukprot:2733069-Rhodomonas_salina.3
MISITHSTAPRQRHRLSLAQTARDLSIASINSSRSSVNGGRSSVNGGRSSVNGGTDLRRPCRARQKKLARGLGVDEGGEERGGGGLHVRGGRAEQRAEGGEEGGGAEEDHLVGVGEARDVEQRVQRVLAALLLLVLQ